jgi:hypothetical protein
MELMQLVIILAATITINIIGWVVTYTRNQRNFGETFGRLSQKVDNLDNTINNGLCERVDGISRNQAKLEGVVQATLEAYGTWKKSNP